MNRREGCSAVCFMIKYYRGAEAYSRCNDYLLQSEALRLCGWCRENNYEMLAYETVCAEVTMGENPWKSSDFKISVAHRDRASELITV
mgnify:CR=1 FL=1